MLINVCKRMIDGYVFYLLNILSCTIFYLYLYNSIFSVISIVYYVNCKLKFGVEIRRIFNKTQQRNQIFSFVKIKICQSSKPEISSPLEERLNGKLYIIYVLRHYEDVKSKDCSKKLRPEDAILINFAFYISRKSRLHTTEYFEKILYDEAI